VNLLPDTRVYLAVGSTDMRKAINGLSLLVEQAMGFSPFSGDLFAFCNRQCTDDAAPPEQPGNIVIAAHSRKKSGRKPLPENLPRAEIIHDLPEEEKVCACGAVLSRIGQLAIYLRISAAAQ